MEDTMQVLYFQKERPTSQYHGNILHKEAISDIQLNDKHAIFPNIIFDVILKNENL